MFYPYAKTFQLSDRISSISGVGPKTDKLLSLLGIRTIQDLIEYYPRAYQDRINITKISQLKGKGRETIIGQTTRHIPYLKIKKVVISDGTGSCFLLFFGEKVEKFLPLGTKLIITGRAKRYRGFFSFSNFEYEIIKEGDELSGIVPLYRLTSEWGRYGQRQMRRIVKACLSFTKIDDMYKEIVQPLGLFDLEEAFLNIHFPRNWGCYQNARKRLSFDELFLLQLALQLNKKRLSLMPRKTIYEKPKTALELPFELTFAQKRVISEIERDFSSPHLMNRLLHGDVGSGKTIVALWMAHYVASNGFQVAIMAPTEILADQHYASAKKIFQDGIKIALLKSGISQKEQKEIKEKIANGEINIVIGTHSLIQEDVSFKNLSFVIIDEQHRFGVSQRQTLIEKARGLSSLFCDVLVMTATPIPRTLALSLYGDMDISCLDEMPKNRGKIITAIRSEKDLEKIYLFIKDKIREGRQAYIVYPLIEESEKTSLKSIKKHFEKLSKIFSDFNISLLHGRIKPEEKEETMKGFSDGKINILVATTVIEVGIDVPNATIMLIEDSERFGLSQLHQLRGRIGRGAYNSYCILITKERIIDMIRGGIKPDRDDEDYEAVERLSAIKNINNGFELAEYDLRIRGCGEFFGERQHGMPDLKLADPIRDERLLVLAKDTANNILEKDPILSNYPKIKDLLLNKFKGSIGLGVVR
ncbi:TPA: ATP-dependent DNA helicase RecG [bacterium]|nr:ATP-dependent DNA helicase RecG [bacterium]